MSDPYHDAPYEAWHFNFLTEEMRHITDPPRPIPTGERFTFENGEWKSAGKVADIDQVRGFHRHIISSFRPIFQKLAESERRERLAADTLSGSLDHPDSLPADYDATDYDD